SKDKDHWASNVVYPSFVVFPFFYLVQLAAAWFLLPRLWAFLYSLTLPYTGYYALLYGERAGLAGRRARTFFAFLVDRSRQERLVQEGREIIGRIRALEAQLRTKPTPGEHDGRADQATDVDSVRALP